MITNIDVVMDVRGSTATVGLTEDRNPPGVRAEVATQRVLAFDPVAELDINVGAGFPTGKVLPRRSADANCDNTVGLFDPFDDDQIAILLVHVRHALRVAEPAKDATITVLVLFSRHGSRPTFSLSVRAVA